MSAVRQTLVLLEYPAGVSQLEYPSRIQVQLHWRRLQAPPTQHPSSAWNTSSNDITATGFYSHHTSQSAVCLQVTAAVHRLLLFTVKTYNNLYAIACIPVFMTQVEHASYKIVHNHYSISSILPHGQQSHSSLLIFDILDI